MARADSTVRVNIIGDAKSLTRAADTSTGAIGGLNKKLVGLGAGIGIAFAVDKVFEFGDTSVKEADRVADATGRLEKQLGKLSQPLIDAADEFAFLGQSNQDMLELEARVADIGTAAGLADDKLAPFAQSAAELAAKMALATDTEADVWIDKIGKALASNDFRVLKDLGIDMNDAEIEARALADTGETLAESLTETELAAAAQSLVLEKLNALYGDVGTGAGDVEQRQAELQARMETLSGEIGGQIEGPLNDLLGWTLASIDGWELLGTRLGEAGVDMELLAGSVKLLIAPFLVLNDVIGRSIDLLGQFFATSGQTTTRFGGTAGPRAPGIGGSRNTTTINVQGGSPEVIEQSVRRALQQATSRSGPLQ